MNCCPITLVCFAVKEEARDFREYCRGKQDIRVVLTGMGVRNARREVSAALAEIRPARVITAGFAGGLNPALSRGTVVFSKDDSSDLALRLRQAGARPGSFYCAEQVVTTAAEKRALYERLGAEAVEMESGCIQELCAEAKIPVFTVRVILDTAQEDLALDFNALMTSEQQLDRRKLATTLFKSPRKIASLIRLQRHSAAGAKRLAEVLSGALEQMG